MAIKKRLALAAVCSASMLLGAAPAGAVATMYITDLLGNTVYITDGGAGDLNGAAGVVTWIGALGVWNVNVSTGVSHSPNPSIDLNSINQSTSAGSLRIYFMDSDFFVGAGPQAVTMLEQMGGTTDGTVSWQSAWSDSNLVFIADALGNTNPVSGVCPANGPAGPGAYSLNSSCNFAIDGLFALNQAVTITHQAAGLTSYDYRMKVPEPGTLMLLGLGLLGIGSVGVRRRKV